MAAVGFAIAGLLNSFARGGEPAGKPLPPRLARSESFLGVHFDFHAGPDCQAVGRRTTAEMVNTIIDRVRPDYLQIDCKGHPGYSSYPTKVGNPVPGFVGDPLRVWRQATAARGVALFMHYSGVWDGRAVALHPEWAAVGANGKPSDRITSVFGPYVDRLLIPQLRELAGDYGVDGAWVDGDCWATMPDYGAAAVAQFRQVTGATAAPQKAGDPYWNEWLDFHREGFRRYVRQYVDALKASHPGFQVISNWAFSDHMPEPVSAGVAALSGDFSPDNSVNSARFAGRCLENQGLPWDLMSWSFSRKTGRQKPAVQLMQEASIVLAQGGGYQAYFHQDREGAVRLADMDSMAEVARFCRARQPYCHRSQAVPQVALLYSTAGHYRSSPRLFHSSGSDGVEVLRSALSSLLAARCSVEIVMEHHMAGHVGQWPLVVVPGWGYLEEPFRKELAQYAAQGGRLLLVGEGPQRLFATEISGSSATAANIACVPGVDESVTDALERLLPHPMVEVAGAADIDLSVRRLAEDGTPLSGRLSVHLINTTGPHADAPSGGIESIKPTGPLQVSVRLKRAPRSAVLQPEGTRLPVTWKDGVARFTVPKLEIYSVVIIEE